MLRRITIALALAGVAIAAPSAFAKSQWNSQMKSATATASRSAGGCTITTPDGKLVGLVLRSQAEDRLNSSTS